MTRHTLYGTQCVICEIQVVSIMVYKPMDWARDHCIKQMITGRGLSSLRTLFSHKGSTLCWVSIYGSVPRQLDCVCCNDSDMVLIMVLNCSCPKNHLFVHSTMCDTHHRVGSGPHVYRLAQWCLCPKQEYGPWPKWWINGAQ